MKKIPQLDNLYLLVKVIECGGLSAAARHLGTTRSLVSRRLIALEQQYATQLIYRDARHFAVTPAGERAYKHAVIMCDAAEAAVAAMREARANSKGVLRIGMHEALSALLADMLPTYTQTHPQLRIVTDNHTTIDALLEQRVDMILHCGHTPPNSGDIVARS